MSVKNKLFANFINNQDPKIKEEFHTHYKTIERNWDNIKNIWTGIKSLISLKTVASSVPTVLFFYNGNTNFNPYDIANTFDNHFAFIDETMKKRHKIFT